MTFWNSKWKKGDEKENKKSQFSVRLTDMMPSVRLTDMMPCVRLTDMMPCIRLTDMMPFD